MFVTEPVISSVLASYRICLNSTANTEGEHRERSHASGQL